MGETDRQTDKTPDKTTQWAFTAYEGQWPLFNTTVQPEIVAEIGWQTEVCPDTQREHYQGYLRTTRQVRFSQLQKIYPGVHIKPAREWAKLVNYCKKKDTAKPGTQVHHENKKEFLTMSQALTKLAAHRPYVDSSRFMDMDEKQVDAFQKKYYWDCVQNILRTSPDEIGLYSQPQYFRAFVNTKQIWLDLADLSTENIEWETDRQTDIPEGVPAFEN